MDEERPRAADTRPGGTFFFVCLPMLCVLMFAGPIVGLFALHRAIAPHLPPALSPFATMNSALEARSADFSRRISQRLHLDRVAEAAAGALGVADKDTSKGGKAKPPSDQHKQQQRQQLGEKTPPSPPPSAQADDAASAGDHGPNGDARGGGPSAPPPVPPAGDGGRCDTVREDALVRRLRSEKAAVAEEAAQALWECWLRERGEARYAEIQAATRAMDAGEHARAEAIFTRLVAAHPGWAEPLNKHSTLLYTTRRFAEAAELCLRVLELKPAHFGALSGLAMCLIRLGQLDAAEAWAQRLGQLQPCYARPLLDEIANFRRPAGAGSGGTAAHAARSSAKSAARQLAGSATSKPIAPKQPKPKPSAAASGGGGGGADDAQREELERGLDEL